MQKVEYRTVDKSAWGDGPWQNEPDKIQWQDEATGYPCLIVRSGKVTGALCGYVGVSRCHPLHGHHYSGHQSSLAAFSDRPLSPLVDQLKAHGGLSHAGGCGGAATPDEEARLICHKVGPGETEDTWWFGFDCAHAFDLMPNPMMNIAALRDGQTYRDVAYVTAECENLAQQLKQMENGNGSQA